MSSIIAEAAAPEINQSLSRIFTVITDLDGNTLSVNDVFFRIMGLPREKLFNQPFISFFEEPGSILLPRAGLASFFSGNDAIFECLSTLRTAGKKNLALQWTVTQLHVAANEDTLLQWSGIELAARQKMAEN